MTALSSWAAIIVLAGISFLTAWIIVTLDRKEK